MLTIAGCGGICATYFRIHTPKPMPITASEFVDSVLRPEVHEEVDMIMRKTDLTPEDLLARLKDGKVYMADAAERAVRWNGSV